MDHRLGGATGGPGGEDGPGSPAAEGSTEAQVTITLSASEVEYLKFILKKIEAAGR